MLPPSAVPFAWFFALLVSGLTAGMFLMDGLGYHPVLARLTPEAAITLHQQSVPPRRALFRTAIGMTGLTTLLLLMAFARAGATRWLLIAQLVSLGALVIYTNAVLVPLNQEIATWNPVSPPPGWQGLFSKTALLERLRCFLPAIAFALQLAAFVTGPAQRP